jgi:hypothetical protein
MVQKRILDTIKDYLEKEWGLDMYGPDVRFAYVIYFAYMQDFEDKIKTIDIIKGAYELAPKEKVSYESFQRSIYRALKNVTPNKSEYVKLIMQIAKQIEKL